MSNIEIGTIERAKTFKNEVEKIAREKNSRAKFLIVFKRFDTQERKVYIRKRKPDGEVIYYDVEMLNGKFNIPNS